LDCRECFEGSMLFFSELFIDAKLVRLLQLWSSQYATPKLASDELVDHNLLLKEFVVCHSSHILRPHFDEEI